MALDNPLWQYALDLYARPGVTAAALQLQAAGASINRLLLACYLARQGRELPPDLLAGAACDWQRAITHPLRAVRYRVREQKQARPELDACYRRLREAELATEQVELMLLWQQLGELSPDPAPPGPALARRNLQRVLHGIEGDIDAPLETLIGAAFPAPGREA
jgi:uncharacterized protein (TIGR02444 family)